MIPKWENQPENKMFETLEYVGFWKIVNDFKCCICFSFQYLIHYCCDSNVLQLNTLKWRSFPYNSIKLQKFKKLLDIHFELGIYNATVI